MMAKGGLPTPAGCRDAPRSQSMAVLETPGMLLCVFGGRQQHAVGSDDCSFSWFTVAGMPWASTVGVINSGMRAGWRPPASHPPA